MKTMDQFIDWRNKNRLISENHNHQSKECIDVEPLKSIFLHSKGGEFSFQCSCGEKHQFQHIENKEGLLLRLK